ncbi:MAG: hypothetical protein WKG00_15950 [Polyangiaceae bacterium]
MKQPRVSGELGKVAARAARVASLALLGAAALGLGGCASELRFKDQPVIWRVDDARHIAEPEENEYLKLQYFADIFAMRRLNRSLELHDHETAHDINALDEVPDSTWFENRIGMRDVSAAEVTRGSSDKRPTPPLRVTGAKVGGGNAGFTVVDAKGSKYLVKFDRKDNPEMQTGSAAAIIRLFWAMGYNVPSDNVFILRRDDLVIDPKATYKDELEDKHPFTEKELKAVFDTSPRLPDGSWRALSSELLPGKPVGGVSPEGVRKDDPNDKIPHQHRRPLRGLRVFAAWLGHTDMKQDNTFDAYVEQDGRKFVRHYLIDFGEALGGHWGEKRRDEDGYEHYWDWQAQPKGLITFGLWRRPWEDRIKTPWPAVGAFAVADFDPEEWREAYPYFPFFETDEADSYWAAKITMRFERRHIEAAVAAGQYTDPAAAKYLVETIIGRQRKIGQVYLERATSFDELTIRPGALCGVDLGIKHGLATAGTLEVQDDDDHVVQSVALGRDGRACVRIPDDPSYAVMRLRTVRSNGARPVMQVHLKGGAAARILGVVRFE